MDAAGSWELACHLLTSSKHDSPHGPVSAELAEARGLSPDANLGNGSTDVPIEQKRELREHSHLALKDGGISVSCLLHDDG
jgi:hypothetical protein